MIDLNMHEAVKKRNAQRCRERNIILPTFAQMKDPSLVPESVKKKLSNIGLWDIETNPPTTAALSAG